MERKGISVFLKLKLKHEKTKQEDEDVEEIEEGRRKATMRRGMRRRGIIGE